MVSDERKAYLVRLRGYREVARKASDPRTSPAELRRLSAEAPDTHYPAKEEQEYFDMLASHPNTPPDLLRHWLPHAPTAFLRNPALPLLLLEVPDFFEGVPEEVQLTLLSRADAPRPVVRVLSVSPIRTVARAARLHIAYDTETDIDEETEEREALKELPFLRSDACHEFAMLGLFPEWMATRVLAWSVDWSKPIGVKAVAPIPDNYVLPETPPEPPPGGWEALLSLSEQQRIVRAGDPSLPVEALTLFARDKKRPVRFAVVRNPATPTALLKKLVESEDDTARRHIAVHPNATPDILCRLCQFWQPDIAWSVLQCPDPPRKVVTALAKHSDVGIRLALYYHLVKQSGDGSVPPAVLKTLRVQALADAERSEDTVRAYFALPQVRARPARLQEFARSPEWLRRLAAARHPNTSPKLRQHLAEQDGNCLVRAAARQALQNVQNGVS
jgi:hypothetical protein